MHPLSSARAVMLPRALAVALATATALASACPVPADTLPPSTDAALAQLVVTPASLTLDIGATAALAVRGVDENGDDVDIADRLAFTTEDDAIATVDDAGLVTAVAVGKVTVTARVGLIAREVPVDVVVAAPPDGLVYPSPLVVTAGVAMEAVAPTSTGGTILTYAATGLPRGLAIDERTGVISGVPTVPQLLGDVVVTGTNGSGTTSATFEIEVRCERDSAPDADDDRPDSAFLDDNGDGIDGMACGPVFVSPLGDDDDSGLLEAPLASIGAALALAASLDPPRDVYLSAGDYVGPIALASGVSLYGGYDPATFARAAAHTTRIAGGRVAVTAIALDDDVELAQLEIVAADSLVSGEPSIGVFATDNAGLLTLTDVVVQAGAGADGTDGVDGGAQPAGGDDGAGGDAGCEGSTFVGCAACAQPAPGPLVVSPIVGGNGGRGGAPGLADQGGEDGGDGEGGAFGGLRGLGFTEAGGSAAFVDGLAGDDGAPGVDGADGLAGLAGLVGADGTDGGDGEGGGGGGGGAGFDSGCDDFGGAGGAGGAGAAGGTAGRGGARGGGSFGVVIVNTDVVIDGAQIVAGAGGDGGDGGDGAPGGIGGDPGPGSNGFDGSGAGGAGGQGGDGGRGGHGGGGGGGASVAVLVDDEGRVGVTASTLLTGQAGAGGTGPGNLGAPGVVAEQREGLLP